MKNGSDSTVAYICPSCGGTVVSGVDIFKLTGDMMKLKCSCGESELVVIRDGGKVRFTVPCFLCGKPHTFVFSDGNVSSLFRGSCPFSGLGIFFLGKKDEVCEEARRSSEEILAVLAENGAEMGDLIKNSGKTPKDAHIRDMLMLVLTELLEDGRIFCGCTEAGEDGDYGIRETDEAVVVECGRCGRKRAAFCDDSIDTQNLLEADSLTLI
ncbi:MAG: hypothetical protein J5940_06620 [Clostridia bacterium]|nr:hypothetical protein [Clostridia bacterium]